MPFVYAFLGFAALIILHEAGHFAAAKAVGMRVERFSLFFGPMLVKKRWGETQYGIAPIPLGGYVKITGMNPREELAEEQELRELRERLDKARGDEPQAERDALSTQIRAAEVELESIRQRAYYKQKVWKRVVVILAGPAVNLLIAFLIVWGLIVANGETVTSHGQPVASHRVGALTAGSAAASSLRVGDTIVSVDGVRGSVDGIRGEIGAHLCPGQQANGCLAAKPARVVVNRGGKILTLYLRPRYSSADGRMLLGFAFDNEERSVGPLTAARVSVTTLANVTKDTLSVIGRIFEAKERKQLHGVVGSYTVTEKSFAQSPTLALWVLAVISLSLAVINLFPFLPLDGGHVFWALAEKVRGRRIPFEVMERASVVGFGVILIVFVIGLSNDISTLNGPGFNLR